MKPLFAALSAALLLGTSISAQAAEQTTPTDRSIQVYKKADIIVSGKGLFTDSEGKQTEVGAGDITIARPGQSHALKNIGKKPLVFLDLIAETAGAKAAETK